MIIKEMNNKLVLENVGSFNTVHIFECGQCFRWNKEEDGSYTGVVQNKVINVIQNGTTVIFDNMKIDDYDKMLKHYFDMETDYDEIKKAINVDDIINNAINFGDGIRILNQDEWETMISFMISANNRIPMIKRVIESLSIAFGDYICSCKGKDYYAFPTAEKLAKAPLEKIQMCKAGFRSERIRDAAKRFLEEKEIVLNLKSRTYDEGLEYLKTYKGIGDKVANCILLFSMKKFDTFPVDVWVRRIMQKLYVDTKASDKEIRSFAENKFGKLSGYAQQYLFYFARENNLGID